MHKQLERFFSPAITLYWRGRFGKLGQYYYPDTNKDWQLLKQFMAEAGLPKSGVRITPEQYDAVLAVAGQYNYSITTIGEPDTCLNV